MEWRALQPEAIAIVVAADEFVAHRTQRDAGGAVDLTVEHPDHGGGWMQAQKPAHAAPAHSGALQQQWRFDSACGHDDDWRFDRVWSRDRTRGRCDVGQQRPFE
jgi:hypothetical protein